MRAYYTYPEALAKGTKCRFQIPWQFELPALPAFPPKIPLPDFSFTLPALPPLLVCPLDDDEE